MLLIPAGAAGAVSAPAAGAALLALRQARFAVGAELVLVGLEALESIAAGLVGGAELLEIGAADPADAVPAAATPAAARAAHGIAAAASAGMVAQLVAHLVTVAAGGREAEKGGKNDLGVSHGLSRTVA
jgi:hypothetical protein